MKKIIVLTTINLILPIILFLIIPSIFIRSRQGYSSQTGDQLLPFLNKNPISFDFLSDMDNLEQITLYLKNPSITNNSRIVVDINSPTTVRSVVFYGSNVGDPSSVPLSFPSFNEKSGTKYTVTLSTDNTIHDNLYIISDYQNRPLFQSFYNTSNIGSNLIVNVNRQLKLIKQRSLTHSLVYFITIILLDFIILFKRDTKI